MNPNRCHSRLFSSADAADRPDSTGRGRTPAPGRRAVLAAAILAPIIAAAGAAHAQSLDVHLDAGVGSGLLLGAGDDGTAAGHTPLYMEVEAGFVFDEDHSIEYVLGGVVQLEDTPALGFTPQVRLVREFGRLTGFVSAGVPVFVAPFTRFGLEAGGGALYPIIEDRFALGAQVQLDVFFAGSDLPADSTVLMFNLGLGGRVWF